MTDGSNDHPTARGLFGGFEGHRVPDHAAVNEALSNALISLDANVLLGLYRYPDEFASEFLDALWLMQERVFVSDQALAEFWRNRFSVLADRARARKEVESRLTSCKRSVDDALTIWAKKVAVDESDLEQALDAVTRHFEVLHETVADNHGDDVERYPSPGKDPIVERLESILAGRVGPALSAEEYAAAVKEGKLRHENQIPPGYKENLKDKEHLAEGVAGDYLLWLQSTREAERRQLDLLIVTADEKEDWYWRLRETVIGPRPELSKEFWDLTGRQLFMLSPFDFMKRLQALGGKVSETALKEFAETVMNAVDASRETKDRTDGKWTANAVLRLLSILDYEAPVQAEVIRAAAANGGSVERTQVYAIGQYDPNRMLRGFTRPVARVTRKLQAEGDVGLRVPDMLRPRYDYGVQANAFEVPREVVDLLADLPED